ncbi:hypothetical protein F7725_024435 [Dissostichus mawsoni]|uniref:Uncharacterized protein n=1 Tax=Dissostichus mawsoni TaxID=36200 RepID=A0A7J5XZB8_DISMA|nr:hypothetical protein F7725_024435 [Dissostichus mawsoni]
MPPKAGRGRWKKLAGKYTQKRKPEETEDLEVQEHSTESPTRERKGRKCKKYISPCPTKTPERSPEGSRSPQQSQESRQHSPYPPPHESASPALPAGNSKSKPKVGKGDKGKGKARPRRRTHPLRTRFSKLREGQPKKKSQKRSGDGLSSGDEEDPSLAEEASENDSDRNKFIRQLFGFLKPHIRRHKKDTPASFKDKLALAETGELAGSDDSNMAGSLADDPREPTKKYTGYPTPRPPSRTGTAAEDQPESPTMEMRVTGASSCDLQDRLVQFITREQQVNRATPFCKYLETELDRLHDACLEPAYEEITTVLNHYRKMSRQFRMREAAGDQISPFEDVPSAFQSQQPQQQRLVAVIPVCTSATYSRVSQHQQESALPSCTYYSASRAASSPSAEFQPGPSQWPRNPPPASVWRSQECGYVEQVNQQHNLEQQQQYHTLQPVQGPPPPPLPAQQSQHNVTQDSLNMNKDIDLSALVPHDDNNKNHTET